jgi:hypothetical protein
MYYSHIQERGERPEFSFGGKVSVLGIWVSVLKCLFLIGTTIVVIIVEYPLNKG